MIVEKSVAIASKLIETYLDPAWNDRVTPGIRSDGRMLRATFEKLVGLTSEDVYALWAATRRGEAASIQLALQALIEAACTRGQSDLAWLLGGAAHHVDAIGRTLGADNADTLLRIAQGPNGRAFTQLLVVLDAHALRQDIIELRIVHDETAELEPLFRAVHAIGRNGWREFGDLERAILGPGLQRVSSPEFRDSKDELLLQAADALASALAYCAKVLLAGDQLSREMTRMFTSLMERAFSGNGLCGLLCNPQLTQTLAELCQVKQSL